MLSASAVVPGRVLRTTVSEGSNFLVVWNVHNHALDLEELRPLLALLRADLALAADKPLSHVVFVAGDWSFEAEGERSFAMVDGAVQFASPAAAHVRQHAIAWRSALST